MTDFDRIFKQALEEYQITLDDYAVARFCKYNDLLVEWNEKINLTALTEPHDVAQKHFIDSLMLLRYADIPRGASLIDVGTGAGFPGLAVKIARLDIQLTLLDSLQKRIGFLEKVCTALELDGVTTIHSRAEDGARTELRDSFDFATARAVAPLNILCEYCLPYVKTGGSFLAMKGKTAEEELLQSQNALEQLGGRLKNIHSFPLGDAGERGIIEIEKLSPTPEKYPRKSKQIKNKPL